MRLRHKFALWLLLACAAVFGWAGLLALGLWADLDAGDRAMLMAVLDSRVPLFVIGALALPFVLGVLLRWFVAAYPARALRIAEQLQVMQAANPGHRIEPEGSAEMRRVGAGINALAETLAALQRDVQARIDDANARLAQETSRLAALMSELAYCVLVCNAEGRILLYNAGATRLLERDRPGGEAGLKVGLGRPVFGLLDRRPIEHAQADIARRLARGVERPVARFVTTRPGQLLRAQMAPVLDAGAGDASMGGYVLILEDITRSVERNSRLDQLLHQLTEGTRAALANIRAAAETIQDFPDMDPAQRERLQAVIRDEAERLSGRLDDALLRDNDPVRQPWPLEDMLAGDLVDALRLNLQSGLGLEVHCEVAEPPVWLAVDSFVLVRALTDLARRLVQARTLTALVLELSGAGRFVRLALRWQGPPLDAGQLDDWESQPFDLDPQQPAHTLKDVLYQHGGEAWSQADRAAGLSRLCLQLPAAQPDAAAEGTLAARPVYYDFDLFKRAAAAPELDQRPLAELSYTVFDTETTGLSPSEGDEIISIGAVRIVNGRLLRHECFDQLIDPQRAIRAESQKVHGISAEMLAGKPPIGHVLPAFHAFAEDTVLVAHNAAFDMRFLQMKEAATGVRFTQPVLDTLMLSALAHPDHPEAEHRLERIAERLGLTIVGRHSALGDAIVTAEVMLKLIPLLAQRGIHTLAQAREASKRTVYARLDY